LAKVKVNITAAELIRDIRVTPKTLVEIGDFWTKRIQGFTRSGKSLATGERIAALSAGYIRHRAAYQGPKGNPFAPNKSNLTLTGQLLNSLKPTANYTRQSVTVNATGTRTDGLTNDKLAGYVSEQGRPFLGLDEKGRARMIRLIIDDLRRTLKKRRRA
jgi:hypothetical protein